MVRGVEAGAGQDQEGMLLVEEVLGRALYATRQHNCYLFDSLPVSPTVCMYVWDIAYIWVFWQLSSIYQKSVTELDRDQ